MHRRIVSEPSDAYFSVLFFVPSEKRFSAFGKKNFSSLYRVNDQNPFTGGTCPFAITYSELPEPVWLG